MGPVMDGRRFSSKAAIQFNIISVRDKSRHAELRKIWNKAFSGIEVKDYEVLMIDRAIQLGDMLQEICMRAPDGVAEVDLAKKISHFS